MMVVVRRVLSADVRVDGALIGEINAGLLLYTGFEKTDTLAECKAAADKIIKLRIFDSDSGEISIREHGGSLLSISQFTLTADTKKGNRPSFGKSMPAAQAYKLFESFNALLEAELPGKIQRGAFGKDMKISAIDDGPYTLLLDY